MKDYYRILQIVPEAGEAEVKKAYRRLATQYHPDHNPAPDSNAVFQEINEAYQIIGDARQRQVYDLLRQYPEELAAYTAPPLRRPPAAYRRHLAHLDLRPYVKPARIISRISLVFCVLLVVDFFLPRRVVTEPVVQFRIFNRSQRLEVTTPNRVLTIPTEGGAIDIGLEKYNPLEIYLTPVLSSLVAVRLQGVEAPADNNIYRHLVFFPMLLLVLSALGVWGRGSDETTVNFGVAAAIILLITVFLMFLIF